MEYLYVTHLWIEAENIEEAEAIYESGDWEISGHQVFAYDENGDEYEVEI